MKNDWDEKHSYLSAVIYCLVVLAGFTAIRFLLEVLDRGTEGATDRIFITIGWGALMSGIIIPIALGAVYCGDIESTEEANRDNSSMNSETDLSEKR